MCHNLREGGRGTGNRVYNTWPVAALAQAVKRDIGSESRFLPTTPAFDTPFRGGGFSSSDYPHLVWYGKTRKVWLPDGEKISKISLFVLTECTNVTDTKTDRRTNTAWRLRPRLHRTSDLTDFQNAVACKGYQYVLSKMVSVIFAVLEVSFWALTTVVKLPRKF